MVEIPKRDWVCRRGNMDTVINYKSRRSREVDLDLKLKNGAKARARPNKAGLTPWTKDLDSSIFRIGTEYWCLGLRSVLLIPCELADSLHVFFLLALNPEPRL